MKMHNPPHPGGTIKENLIEVGLTITQAAALLDVSETLLAAVVAEQAAIPADLAVRLEMAGWGDAQGWMWSQISHDIWQAEQQADRYRVRRLPKTRSSAERKAKPSRARAEINELASAMRASGTLGAAIIELADDALAAGALDHATHQAIISRRRPNKGTS